MQNKINGAVTILSLKYYDSQRAQQTEGYRPYEFLGLHQDSHDLSSHTLNSTDSNCLIVEKAGRRVEQRTVINKQRFLDGGMTDLYNYSSNS